MTHPRILQTSYNAVAIFGSGLCLAHCLVLPALQITIPALSVWLTLPESFHLWMLIIALPTSLIALYIGQRQHRSWTPILVAMPAIIALGIGALLFHGLMLETWLTVAGAFMLIFAHLLDRRYTFGGRYQSKRTG